MKENTIPESELQCLYEKRNLGDLRFLNNDIYAAYEKGRVQLHGFLSEHLALFHDEMRNPQKEESRKLGVATLYPYKDDQLVVIFTDAEHTKTEVTLSSSA